MAENTSLLERREELKRQLASGEYATLLEVIVSRTGRLIQRLAHNTKPMSFSFSALVVVLVAVLSGLLIALLLDELNPALIQRTIVGTGFLYTSLTIVKIQQSIFTSHLHDHIIDAIESSNDLTDLQHWLSLSADTRAAGLFAMTFGVLSGLIAVSFFFALSGSFVGWGPSTSNVLTMFLYGAGLYNVILFLNLPFRLSRYRFKLYAADPSSSELVHHLSSMFMTFLYQVALLIALATILSAALGLLVSSILHFLLACWALITAMFAMIQYSLSRIITTAKYRTLTQVQAKIETLQADANLTEKETREAINWLMDYHDRIKATRNSALDLRSALNFVNSLLLPLVAFLLGNLDTIVALFR